MEANDLRTVDVEKFQSHVSQIPACASILCIIGVIGGLGNGLVLLVYAKKNDKQTATLFILVLAMVDFFTCIVLVPFTMLNEILNWEIGSNMLCKAYYLLNISNTLFSTLLISAIAIDRYLCICHPFLRAMTVHRAKIFVTILAGVSLTLGSCAIPFAFLANEPIMDPTGRSNSTEIKTVCTDLSQMNSTASHTENLLFQTILKITHACFALCILIVVILYVLIYRSILVVRKKKRILKGTRMKTITTLVNVTTGDQGIVPIVTNNEEKLLEGENTGTELDNNRRKSLRYLKDTQTFQNMKTAMMLFVVALVFIVTFIPAILMGNDVISLNLIVFYLYYLNNAANPIIYGFMNRNFREDVRKLFSKFKEGNNNTERF